MYCRLLTAKSIAEGQTLARREHNILRSAVYIKSGRKKLHLRGNFH